MTVCRWELGRTEPSAEDLGNVADALSVPFSWVALGRGESPCSGLAAKRVRAKRKARSQAVRT